jgi:hypothetical protein
MKLIASSFVIVSDDEWFVMGVSLPRQLKVGGDVDTSVAEVAVHRG